jgi:hypothetical protein
LKKKQYYFGLPYFLIIRSRDHFWAMVQCKKVLKFFSDHDQRFYLVIPKIFAKNNYCKTVKIKKKTHKYHFVLKFIDNFISDLVIND